MRVIIIVVILVGLLLLSALTLYSRDKYIPSTKQSQNNFKGKIIYKVPNIPQFMSLTTGYPKSIQVKRTAKNEQEILDWGSKQRFFTAYHCFWTVKPQRQWVVLVSDTGSGAYVLQAFVYLCEPKKACAYELKCIATIGTFSDASALGGAYINPKSKVLILHDSDGKVIRTVALPDFDKWVHR